MMWLTVVALSVLGSVGGLVTAAALVTLREDIRARIVPWLVSYAVGTLLGAALLGVVPEALLSISSHRVFLTLVGGILTFFTLEKLVIWRHCHDEPDCAVHRSTVSMVVVGDAVHTFVDGAVIAATALVSLPLGLTTALAVTTHEIPHQAGDVAVLLSRGQTRGRAFLLTVVAATSGIAGAVAMLVFGHIVPGVLPYALAFAGGNFLYVAMSDLIPHLHHGHEDRNPIRQVVLISLGVATMYVL